MSLINQEEFANKYMSSLFNNSQISTDQTKDKKLTELTNRIVAQNNKLLQDSNAIYNENAKLNHELESQFTDMKNILHRIERITPHRKQNPLLVGIDHKMAEFHRITEANNEKIKKNNESIPDIQRKKKENDDFFKKFHGEKKVWLDRIKEKDLRDDAYGKGFKYLYEAKTVKMLLEGILLEKVQDEVEKVLIIRGQMYGWDVLDEAKLLEERRKNEFELNKQVASMTNQEEAIQYEQEQKSKWEQEDKSNEQKRQVYLEIWRQLWSELWLPKVPLSTEQTLVNQRELMKNVTLEVTFNMFKKLCFDVWKFKNMINSSEEYIILDKIRRYFPEDGTRSNHNELILDRIMDIIENIKQEEEVIYCDLSEAKAKLKEYEKVDVSTSIERLKTIIQKIENIQLILKSDSTKLLKLEVEEIRSLIKSLPDDNEKKLFKDNLKNKSRLYDKYLPLTTLLMIISFISVGKKRNKGYQEKIDNFNKEIETLKLQNKEIEGKWAVLREVNEKIKNEQLIEGTTPENEHDFLGKELDKDFETILNNNKTAKDSMSRSHIEMSLLIQKLNNLQNEFFNQISHSAVQINGENQ